MSLSGPRSEISESELLRAVHELEKKASSSDAEKEDPVDKHLMALGFGSKHWAQSVEWLGYY